MHAVQVPDVQRVEMQQIPLPLKLSCTNSTLEQKLKNQFVPTQTTQGDVRTRIVDIATITKVYEGIAN